MTDASATVHPFDLLRALHAQFRSARTDTNSLAQDAWTGFAFRLREHWLVAPRDEVREILPAPAATRIPGALPWLMGVANHRGNLLAVTDLGVFFGFSAIPPNREQRVLVLNSGTLPAGFLVDEVGGYRQFAPTDQRHELVHTGGALEPFLLGAFVREGRPWLTLSLRKVAHSDAFVHASL